MRLKVYIIVNLIFQSIGYACQCVTRSGLNSCGFDGGDIFGESAQLTVGSIASGPR